MLHCSMVRRGAILAGVVLMAAASASWGAEPEILQQIPGDAYGVVFLNNVKVAANKVSNAATRLQMSLPSDLVGTMTHAVGITSGFDANGSMALVLLKPGAERAGQPYFESLPPMVLLVPTTNSSMMMEKFDPTAPDKDGIMGVALPDDPDQKGFAVVVEKKWVAVAQKKEDLAAYVGRGASFAKTVGAETLKVFDGNDLVIWGNVEKLGAGADKWVEDQRVQLTGMRDLTNFVDGQDVLAGTLEKAGMRMGFDVMGRFMKDAGASMLTVRLTDSGATLGLIADFKADSPMGKFVAAQAPKGDAVSLKGLPAGNFLVAGAGQWNAEAVSGAVGDFLKQIAGDPSLAKDPRLPEIKQEFEQMKQATGLMSGMRFMMLEPPAKGKDGYLNGAFLVETSDAKKLLDVQTQMSNGKLAQEGMTPDMKQTVTVTPNALTVKEVVLTKTNVKYALREETPDKPIPATSKEAFDTMQKMYGANGLTMYAGVVGKRMLVVYGSDLNMIESAVTAAQTDSDAAAKMPEIEKTKDQLVAQPIAAAYLPIARWVTLAQGILAPGAEGQAASAPGAAITGAPPAVVSLGVSGHMLTAEVHVPIETIIGTQEAVQRLEKAGGVDGGGLLPNLP